MFAILTTLGLAAFLAFQHNGLRRLQTENGQLSAAQIESSQLKSDLAFLETWQDVTVEITNLQAQNHELPKLRNEVHELREQVRDLESLRTESARLRAQMQQVSAQSSLLPPFPGAGQPILSKDSLTNAGFATPEATAQTFFWALREANQVAWVNCHLPQMSQQLSAKGTNTLFTTLMKRNANVTGYIIPRQALGQQSKGPDHISLTVFGITDASSAIVTMVNGQVQSGPGRIGFGLRMRKLDEEWKVEQ